MATTESVSTKLEYLRRLAAERTKGEWQPTSLGQTVRFISADMEGCIASYFERQDSAFIAAAANHFDALLDIAEAAAEFERNSHEYPDQTNFFVSDQNLFLISQSNLAKALAKLQEIK